jgi:hypothetical protein
MSANLLLALAVWTCSAGPDPAGDREAAELRAAFARLAAGLGGGRVRSVELKVRIPRVGGGFDHYPVFLVGEEAVDEAVRRFAGESPRRDGAAPADAAKREQHLAGCDVLLVFERFAEVVELEKRGEVLLDLIAEDDPSAKPPPPRPAVQPPAVVALSAGPERFELLLPDDPGLRRATVAGGKLRELLLEAVDRDARRAADIWGGADPPLWYGLARSALAEGVAYAALGRPQKAEGSLKRCVEICTAQGKWDHLAAEAKARLAKPAAAKP